MHFEFNVYSSLLLPAVVHGVIFSGLLFARAWSKEHRSDYLLAALVFIYTLDISHWMLGYAGWYDTHDGLTTFMFYFPFSQWYLLGPLTYFYFRSLTNAHFRWERKHWLHFLPAIAVLAMFFYCFAEDVVWEHWIQGMPFTEHFNTKGDKGQGNLAAMIPFDVLWPLVLLGYLYVTLKQFRQYRRYVDDQYSDTEAVRLDWLQLFLWASVLAVVTLIGFFLANQMLSEGLSYAQAWYKFFAWGVLLYAISIGGYYTRLPERQPPVFEPQEEQQAPLETNPASDPEWQNRLRAFMEEKQPYLDAELTLNDLAARLRTSPSILSRQLNQQLGQNFNDFINTYRVAEMKRRLADPANAHLSLLGIAYSCGFNSKATFNRAFKKISGQAPSDFLRNRMKTPGEPGSPGFCS